MEDCLNARTAAYCRSNGAANGFVANEPGRLQKLSKRAGAAHARTMRTVPLLLLLLANACAAPRAERPTEMVPTVPPELLREDPAIQTQRARFNEALRPEARPRLLGAEQEFLRRLASYTASEELVGLAREAALSQFGSLDDADIEALCFLVLMEASKSSQDDLRAIMAGVQAIEAAQACKHDIPCLQKLAPVSGATPAQLDSIRAHALDEPSKTTESMRLQMAMDHVSKLMTALSNILKKMQDTDSAILQNIK